MSSPDLYPASQEPHFTRLSQLGWGQCGRMLSSRPRESGDMPVTHPFLFFFGGGPRWGLFHGTFKLRCSISPFSKRFSSWSVTHQPRMVPEVGRPAKRARIPFQQPSVSQNRSRIRMRRVHHLVAAGCGVDAFNQMVALVTSAAF